MESVIDASLIEQTAEMLVASKYTVVLTGAGISKESGIPTFRGKDGLWTIRGEPPMNQFQQFHRDPKAWWLQRIEQRNSPDDFAVSLRASEPNDAHYALAELAYALSPQPPR